MFLSKRPSGIWYLFYGTNPRKKISTGTKVKSEALQFLRNFTETQKPTVPNLTLSEFKAKYLEYSKSIHSRSTQEHHKFSYHRLIGHVGDIHLRDLTIQQIHSFLTRVTEEASK